MPATIVAPEQAPRTKLDAIERLGGQVVKVPYERWWEIATTSRYEGADGLFVHPVQDERVIAGNGTIGLELAEELPGCRRSAGSVGRRRPLHRDRDRTRRRQLRAPGSTPSSQTGAAVTAAFEAASRGRRRFCTVVRRRRRRQGRSAGDVGARPAAARRRGGGLAGRHGGGRAPARGAGAGDRRRRGALALAAALSGRIGGRRLVCIVWRNIDADRLASILRGETPTRAAFRTSGSTNQTVMNNAAVAP